MTRLNSKLSSTGCSVPLTEHYDFTGTYEGKLPEFLLADLTRLKIYTPTTKTIMNIGIAACSNVVWSVFLFTGQ
jgi:hypothetical protein